MTPQQHMANVALADWLIQSEQDGHERKDLIEAMARFIQDVMATREATD